MEGSNQNTGKSPNEDASPSSQVMGSGRRWLLIGLPILLGVVVVSAFLSVNVFPIVGNDSVLYLDHSLDLRGTGFVEYGYRQIGYPLALAVTRLVANTAGAEPFLSMAMLQRALLVVAGYLAWRFWRWWSLPLIAFLVAAETLAFSNFLLTESLAFPVAVLLVFPTIRLLEIVGEDAAGPERRVWTLAGVIVAMVVGLFTMRFTFAVFGAVPLVTAVAGWRTRYRGVTLTMLGVSVAFMGLLSLATSLENQREHDVFFPNASGPAVEYYFAWQQVFELHPENPHDPDLADFYDRGLVHDFSREVGAMNLSPQEEQVVFDEEIEAMLEAGGLSVFGSRVQSFSSALTGGRLDDLAPAVAAAIEARRLDVDPLIYLNQYTMRNSPEEFVEEYNSGQPAEVVVTDPIGVLAPVPPAKNLVAWMLPVSLGIMAIGLAFRSTRSLSTIGILVVLSFALGVGWIRADNWRFLMPTSGFGIAVGSGVLYMLVTNVARSRRREEAPLAPLDDDQGEHGASL